MIGKHATTIASDNLHTIVTFHHTQIVKFNINEIILNSGGWQTATTKLRMNQTSETFNLGYTIYQKNFEWFIKYKNINYEFYDNIKLVRE